MLIGGLALNPANDSVDDSGRIDVVAPPTILDEGLMVEVQTTVGTSKDPVTIHIIPSSQVSVQAQPFSAVAGQASGNLTVGFLADSDQNAPASGFSATIDRGDGDTSIGTVRFTAPGEFAVSGSHAYASAGRSTFSIQVTDAQDQKTLTSGLATATPA